MALTQLAGIVDSSTVSHAFIALSKRSSSWTDWDWKSLLTATLLLMYRDLVIPPRRREYHGLWAAFPRHLASHQLLPPSRTDLHSKLEAATNRWAAKSSAMARLRNALRTAVSDASFPEWANDHARLIWLNDVQMHTELFNRSFIPRLATLLDCPRSDLHQLHARTSDLSQLEPITRCRDVVSKHNLLVQTYVAAGILRGHYHKRLAELTNLHLAVHPYRRPIVAGDTPSATTAVSSLDYNIAVRIICSAIQPRKPIERAASWTKAIASFRGLDGSLYQHAAELSSTPEEADRHAVEITGRIGLPSLRQFPPLMQHLPTALRLCAHPLNLAVNALVEFLTDEHINIVRPIGPSVRSALFELQYRRLVRGKPRICFIEREA